LTALEDSTAPNQARAKPRGGRIRRHWPFLLFFAALVAYCAYLQLEFRGALGQLFFVRIFFQIALAALVIAILKNVVGVKTLGMFAPVIIALALLFSGVVLGLSILGAVLGVVVLTRAAMVRERVQEAHRVAILVTMTGVTITSLAIVGLELGQHELFFGILLPVLISSWMAERYVEQVRRVGWEAPSAALGWTLAGVIISFLVITQDPLVDFVLTNPLTWSVLVALHWFLGTRIRFRLGDRFRFSGIRRYNLGDGPTAGDFGDDVLTMPVRNREFVERYNAPELMALLSKDRAKALLVPQGIPMARTFLTLHLREDLGRFRTWLDGQQQFVIKPAGAHGGEGIILVWGRDGDVYETNEGRRDPAALEAHARAILDGEYRGGTRDAVVVEELLHPDGELKDLAAQGLPDLRIICFRGYPVMAMARIPTRASGGKANLHLGAIAAGVRLSTGRIVHAVWRGFPYPVNPDTGARLVGRQVPRWREILEIAAEAQSLSGLGFAGVDIAIDAQRGVVVMEVNRRPGLEIQNANAAGLLRRLRMVESLGADGRSTEERIAAIVQLDAANWGVPSSGPGAAVPAAGGPSPEG